MRNAPRGVFASTTHGPGCSHAARSGREARTVKVRLVMSAPHRQRATVEVDRLDVLLGAPAVREGVVREVEAMAVRLLIAIQIAAEQALGLLDPAQPVALALRDVALASHVLGEGMVVKIVVHGSLPHWAARSATATLRATSARYSPSARLRNVASATRARVGRPTDW